MQRVGKEKMKKYCSETKNKKIKPDRFHQKLMSNRLVEKVIMFVHNRKDLHTSVTQKLFLIQD